jgi:GNAT superfamily N-acetyltransferase
MIEISPLRPDDRARWDVLARGYKTFYRTELPDAEYDKAWARMLGDEDVHGIGARIDGRLVGIAHYLFHPSPWMGDVCYLQDLFTDEDLRGKGIARALIERVAAIARERHCPRFYWLTQEGNTQGRALYDKVAAYKGFIRYDYPMG